MVRAERTGAALAAATDRVTQAEAAVAAAGDRGRGRPGHRARRGRGPQPRGDRAAGRAGHDPGRRCAAGPQQQPPWRAGRPTSASSPPPASSRRRPPPWPTPPTCPPGSPPPWTRPAGRCPASPGPSSAAARSPCCPPRPSSPSARRCPSSASPSSTAPPVPTPTTAAGSPPRPGCWPGTPSRRRRRASGRRARRSPLTDLQVGDLVFSPGGQDVGIYLGDGDVVGASAGSYQVGVRSVAAGSSATRVTLPAPATPNAGAALRRRHRCLRCRPAGARCGQPGVGRLRQRPDPGRGAVRPGRGPPCPALRRRGVLRPDERGVRSPRSGRRCASPTRTGPTPARCRPSPASRRLAAVPGTSNHGWALAVDLCGGINIAGSAQWTWMTANAGRFGFVQPGLGAPGRREARAVALGVRLHLVTSSLSCRSVCR